MKWELGYVQYVQRSFLVSPLIFIYQVSTASKLIFLTVFCEGSSMVYTLQDMDILYAGAHDFLEYTYLELIVVCAWSQLECQRILNFLHEYGVCVDSHPQILNILHILFSVVVQSILEVATQGKRWFFSLYPQD